MLINSQTLSNPDLATALCVGRKEQWLPTGRIDTHVHQRHQFIHSTRGMLHMTTEMGVWILPPTRALWIRAGTAHGFLSKHPVEVTVLYIDKTIPEIPDWPPCTVLNVSPLVRELVTVCATHPWDYSVDSKAARLAKVLLEQLDTLAQAPLHLPEPSDPRAIRLAERLKKHPNDTSNLATLAGAVGASLKTMERLFLAQTQMTFGEWRLRLRMIVALEYLARGESVSDTAMAVGYESPSSFIVAFRRYFDTTPARYFELGRG